MINQIKPLAEEFMSYCQKKHGFEKPPAMNFIEDEENGNNPLGKTAYYDPREQSITLYITNRHPKDILRSLAHELTHHLQNLRGEFDNIGELGEDYAQTDEHMRKMEFEAYASGLDVRDFEHDRKNRLQKESSNMNDKIKALLRKIIKETISEIPTIEKGEKENELTEKEGAIIDSILSETDEEETLEENEEETLDEEASENTDENTENTKVQTPEQENTIYENRFTSRDNKLFERLLNKWTKK